MSWEISLHPKVESWYLRIRVTDPATADLIENTIDQLAHEDPTAGRPLVRAIRLAEERFAEHLIALKENER